MKILLVVSGMTPQIITETIYGLAVVPEDGVEAWIPDEVHVLSTKSGITQIRGALIEKNRLDDLCAEYDLPKIRFDDSCLHTFQREYKDSDGNTVSEDLEDIKSKEDSSTVADRICEKVRELTSDDNVELHVSIAGGRKTMGYYAGYAMSLYGRAQDSMSHVLVSDAFEQVRDFFYPTKESHPVQNRDGHYLDAKDAQVWLMNLPFVRLRDVLKKTEYLNSDFSETVSRINSANSKINLTFNTANRVVMVNKDLNLAVKLQPITFAFLHWFADLAQNQPDVLVRVPNEEARLCANLQSYFAKNDLGVSLQFNQYLNDENVLETDEDIIESVRAGTGAIILDKKQFSEIKSRLKAELTAVLGSDLTNKILPEKASNKGFKMQLPAEAITFNYFDNRELEQAAKNNAPKKSK